MDVGHGGFGGGDKIQLAQFALLIAFGHAVVLVFKLGELPDAFETLRANNERRGNFGISMLAGVQIEHELNQRPFQLCAPSGVDYKAAASQFGPTIKVNESESLAQISMWLGGEGESGFLAVRA